MLASWNKSYDQPRQKNKIRDITFTTEVHLVKDMVFPVVMYGCESWTIKKLSTKELVILNYGVGEDSSPWTVRRSNQSILKEISPEYWKDWCWSWSCNTLATWYEKVEKTLMLGKIEGRKRKGQQRIGWLDASPIWWIWVWGSFEGWWWTGKHGLLQSMGLQSQTQLSNWTELN